MMHFKDAGLIRTQNMRFLGVLDLPGAAGACAVGPLPIVRLHAYGQNLKLMAMPH